MKIQSVRSLVAFGFLGAIALSLVGQGISAPQEKEVTKETAKLVRTPAELAAMDSLRKQGALVLELAQTDQRLEVSYLQQVEKFGDSHLVPLKDLKGLVRLNLRGQAVTDDLAKHLAPLTDLTHLHLEKTKVTDKALGSVKGLKNLEYLNLYGTAVTDAGLKDLEGLKKLGQLYVWQTKVTKEGAVQLKKVIGKIDVNRGLDDLPPLPKVEVKAPVKEMKKEAKKKDDVKKADVKKAEAKKAEEKKTDAKKDANKK